MIVTNNTFSVIWNYINDNVCALGDRSCRDPCWVGTLGLTLIIPQKALNKMV